MQGNSHRLLFLGATAIMCAVALYGSQAGPTLLLPPDKSASRNETPFADWKEEHGTLRHVKFETTDAAQTGVNSSALEEAPMPGAVSVVPNGTSCPAADAAALVSPPSVNAAIGSPTPIEKTALPRQGLVGAALGTGSSCPPARDVAVQKIPSAAMDSPSLKTTAALPGGVSRP
jgi:hypothetical protein